MVSIFFWVVSSVSPSSSMSSNTMKSGRWLMYLMPLTALSSPIATHAKPSAVWSSLCVHPLEAPYFVTLRSAMDA